MSTQAILEMRAVVVSSRRDPDVATINDVNWSVRAGEFWVVGGLQGSGKSDLMFMLAGLTKPLAGNYTLLDQDMGRHFGDEFLPSRRRIGMVFDDARLFNRLTIAANVALPACYHHDLRTDEADTWTSALLKATEIAEFAASTPSMLGRHWRRRAALARALALRPEVLFLENPLRGLDARHTVWWVNFLQKLWRGHDLMLGKPVTIVASTDEFRPWRNSGAQFATLHERKFAAVGGAAPEDDTMMVVRTVGTS